MKNINAFLLGFILFCTPAFAANPYGNPIPSVQTSTAAGSLVFKATPGLLMGFSMTTGASAGYLLFFDATSVPADGTVTPKFCYSVPATSTYAASWLTYPPFFTNGIVAVFSTTGCFTKTISATAFISGQVQ